MRDQLNDATSQLAKLKRVHNEELEALRTSHQKTSLELRNTLQTARDELKAQQESNEKAERNFIHRKELLDAEVQALESKLAFQISHYSRKTGDLESDWLVCLLFICALHIQILVLYNSGCCNL